jgi:tripartite-type tricarboxylate transporter receptor subunit TctC
MRISVRTKWLLSALVAAALVLPALIPAEAAAQSWPNRPVRLIVTLGPGSGVDIGARLFADKLSARWGQSVVVENRPGGDGMVAITVRAAMAWSPSPPSSAPMTIMCC